MPAIDKYCGRCGCRYQSEPVCPNCMCPEYSLVPDVLYEGWKRDVKDIPRERIPGADGIQVSETPLFDQAQE